MTSTAAGSASRRSNHVDENMAPPVTRSRAAKPNNNTAAADASNNSNSATGAATSGTTTKPTTGVMLQKLNRLLSRCFAEDSSAERKTTDGSGDNSVGPQTRNRGRAEKLKSRWMNMASLGGSDGANEMLALPPPPPVREVVSPVFPEGFDREFELIIDNEFVSGNAFNDRKSRKADSRMTCECQFTPEMAMEGRLGCTSPTECFNRMLYVECGNKCMAGDYCANKRFQRREYASLELFDAGPKGLGVRTGSDTSLQPGDFLLEYVGEVLDFDQFRSRLKRYSKAGRQHWFFMALSSEQYVDATRKGNISRYMNHSCDPNAEMQKWTVNGQVRIGFFARRHIEPGDEVTLDYQFETYGERTQKCLCGSANCRGYIGKLVAPVGVNTTQTPSSGPTDDLTGSPTSSRLPSAADRKVAELAEKIDKLSADKAYICSQSGLLDLCRLMVRAESREHRLAILGLLRGCCETAACSSGRNGSAFNMDSFTSGFIRLHGLDVLWSWLVEEESKSVNNKIPAAAANSTASNTTASTDLTSSSSSSVQLSESLSSYTSSSNNNQLLSLPILQLLNLIPIPNRNVLDDSQLWSVLERLSAKASIPSPMSSSSSSSSSSISQDDVTSSISANDNRNDENTDCNTSNKSQPAAKCDSSDTDQVTMTDGIDVIGALANGLLIKWSTLKTLFRIPRVVVSSRHPLVHHGGRLNSSNDNDEAAVSGVSPVWKRSTNASSAVMVIPASSRFPNGAGRGSMINRVVSTNWRHHYNNNNNNHYHGGGGQLSKELRRKQFEQAMLEEEEKRRKKEDEVTQVSSASRDNENASSSETATMMNLQPSTSLAVNDADVEDAAADQSSNEAVEAEVAFIGDLLAEYGLDLETVFIEISQLLSDPAMADGLENAAMLDSEALAMRLSAFPQLTALMSVLSSSSENDLTSVLGAGDSMISVDSIFTIETATEAAAADTCQQTYLPTCEEHQQQLPPGWSSAVDAETGQSYYYNRLTNQTQWEMPKMTPTNDNGESSPVDSVKKRVSFNEASLKSRSADRTSTKAQKHKSQHNHYHSHSSVAKRSCLSVSSTAAGDAVIMEASDDNRNSRIINSNNNNGLVLKDVKLAMGRLVDGACLLSSETEKSLACSRSLLGAIGDDDSGNIVTCGDSNSGGGEMRQGSSASSPSSSINNDNSNNNNSNIGGGGGGGGGGNCDKFFRNELASYISKLLKPYYKKKITLQQDDSKSRDHDGHGAGATQEQQHVRHKILIKSHEEFKSICRKLTDTIFDKEAERRGAGTALKMSDSLCNKVRVYVDSYVDKLRLKKTAAVSR